MEDGGAMTPWRSASYGISRDAQVALNVLEIPVEHLRHYGVTQEYVSGEITNVVAFFQTGLCKIDQVELRRRLQPQCAVEAMPNTFKGTILRFHGIFLTPNVRIFDTGSCVITGTRAFMLALAIAQHTVSVLRAHGYPAHVFDFRVINSTCSTRVPTSRVDVARLPEVDGRFQYASDRFPGATCPKRKATNQRTRSRRSAAVRDEGGGGDDDDAFDDDDDDDDDEVDESEDNRPEDAVSSVVYNHGKMVLAGARTPRICKLAARGFFDVCMKCAGDVAPALVRHSVGMDGLRVMEGIKRMEERQKADDDDAINVTNGALIVHGQAKKRRAEVAAMTDEVARRIHMAYNQ